MSFNEEALLALYQDLTAEIRQYKIQQVTYTNYGIALQGGVLFLNNVLQGHGEIIINYHVVYCCFTGEIFHRYFSVKNAGKSEKIETFIQKIFY